MKDTPGSVWIYNTGSVHLLSGIIKKTTGLYADEFAEKYLFKPLDINEFEWNTDPMGDQCSGGTHGGLRLNTRDVAKFGLMFLNNGMWNGRQIISEEWIAESTKKQINIYNNINTSGYLWYQGSFKIFDQKIRYIASFGYGGQSLYIVPELNMVIVITCRGAEEDADVFIPVVKIFRSAINR